MWIKDYFKDQVRYQLSDHSSVKIQHKYSEKLNKFFIDSSVGLIVYKPKGKGDVARFRDKWINKIEALRQRELNGENVKFDLCVLYDDIAQEERFSYEANLHTRLSKKWNLLKSKFKIF